MDCRGRRGKQCTLGEVENEAHFVLRCEALLEGEEELIEAYGVGGWVAG